MTICKQKDKTATYSGFKRISSRVTAVTPKFLCTKKIYCRTNILINYQTFDQMKNQLGFTLALPKEDLYIKQLVK